MAKSLSSAVVLSDAEFGAMMDVSLLQQPVKSVSGLTAEQQAIVASTGTKAYKIRALAATGMSRGDIAKTLGIIYQHVRNVLITPLKKG